MATPQLKVIVAEDSDFQRAYLSSLIDALGYDAVPAADGEEALALVAETGAQIVISDLYMPKVDGLQLTRKIREMDGEQYIHIVMMTGSDEVDVRMEALEAGVDDFLTKGGSPAMLKARIRTATRLINHAEELAARNRVLKDYTSRIQSDLQAAAIAQRQLLPGVHDDVLGFGVTSAFVPSAIVSGDMFGCFALNEEKLAFYAVDVSGHGVHASLLSVAIGHLITPEYFRTKALSAEGDARPAALVSDLNTRFSAPDSDAYFTMFCGVVDRSSGRLDYCQAGYPSPFYVTPTGTAAPVGRGGFPVGMLAGAEYDNDALTFEGGGALILCSDAAFEAENTAREPFGAARIADIVSTIPSAGAADVPDSLVDALTQWRNGQPLDDDLTVMSLERKYFS